MEVIGLAGGVASGKSTVAMLFEELGAVSLNADQIGHEVLCEPAVKESLRNEFGPTIFDAAGEVDRSAVARMVFGPDEGSQRRLLFLESITHPRISERLSEHLVRLRRTGCKAVILDAAVMFKAGWDRFCTRIVFIRVPHAVRVARAKSRGWTPAELDSRENRQTPLVEKERKATDFLENDSSLEELRQQVYKLWNSWGLQVP
jgi:dephospho-CoA kinase